MATQNFMAGGYYGKLGATIGQRWKNKRTVKAYAVPSNPRTPEQQSNRNRFATATRLAQLALRFNKGVEMWKSTDKTEFMNRVSVAKLRTDNGIDEWLAIPLYPDGTTPQETLNDVVISLAAGGVLNLRSATLSTLTESRNFTIQIKAYNDNNDSWEYLYYSYLTVVGSGLLLSFSLPSGYSLPEGSTVLGITNDDNERDNTFVYVAPQNIQQPTSIVINDIVGNYSGNESIILTSEVASTLPSSYRLHLRYTVQNGLTGVEAEREVTVDTTIGSRLLATLPIGLYEGSFDYTEIELIEYTADAGAIPIEIPTTRFTLGQKPLNDTITISNAVLTLQSRKAGTIAADLGVTIPNALLTATVRASYKSNTHDIKESELVASIISQSVAGQTYDIPLTFSSCPAAVVDNNISVVFNVQSDNFMLVTSANTTITDPTQSSLTIPNGSEITGLPEKITYESEITQSLYNTLNALSLMGVAVGQNVQTNASLTAGATFTLDTYEAAGATHYIFDVAAENVVYLGTSSGVEMYQTDFETAANAYYFPAFNKNLGRVEYLSDELITSLFCNFTTAAKIGDFSTETQFNLGNWKSSLVPTFALVADDPAVIFKTGGNNYTVNSIVADISSGDLIVTLRTSAVPENVDSVYFRAKMLTTTTNTDIEFTPPIA